MGLITLSFATLTHLYFALQEEKKPLSLPPVPVTAAATAEEGPDYLGQIIAAVPQFGIDPVTGERPIFEQSGNEKQSRLDPVLAPWLSRADPFAARKTEQLTQTSAASTGLTHTDIDSVHQAAGPQLFGGPDGERLKRNTAEARRKFAPKPTPKQITAVKKEKTAFDLGHSSRSCARSVCAFQRSN